MTALLRSTFQSCSGTIGPMPTWDDQPREPVRPSERLAAALGRPAPEPMTAGERAEFERWMDEGDREAERVHRLGYSSAA